MSALMFLFGSLFAFPLPASATTAKNCPWLNQGSAEAALGGSVSATVQVSESGEGSCTFSREQGTPKETLKIVVLKKPLPSCPAGSPGVKGIGNEAVECTVRQSSQESTQMIVSRVRGIYFTVSITPAEQQPASAESSHSDSAIERVAQLVSGNLF
ncbi:MAG: hypothetical protein WBA09_11075 [Candidatus Acidiferrum sp.]